MNDLNKSIEDNRDKSMISNDGLSDHDKSIEEESLNKSRSIQVANDPREYDPRKSHVVEENVTRNSNSTEIQSFHNSSIILGSVATFLVMIILSVLGVIIAIVIRRWKARRARRARLMSLNERQSVLWRSSSFSSADSTTTVNTNVSHFHSSSLPSLNMYSYIDENEVTDYLNPLPLVVEDPASLNHYQNPPVIEDTPSFSLSTFF